MANLYLPKQVQEMLEVSATGLRIYTTTYPDYLSTEATGKRRKFTEADLCFLSFVKMHTEAGDNHKDVQALLKSAEGKAQWAHFQREWEPPEPPLIAEEPEASTALVPMAQLHAARLLLEDAQRREQEARAQVMAQQQTAQQRERELLERIEQMQRELGKAEGKIEALQTVQATMPATALTRSWWARMLGR
jgi:DNA-binding transcriptional MerR regulator